MSVCVYAIVAYSPGYFQVTHFKNDDRGGVSDILESAQKYTARTWLNNIRKNSRTVFFGLFLFSVFVKTLRKPEELGKCNFKIENGFVDNFNSFFFFTFILLNATANQRINRNDRMTIHTRFTDQYTNTVADTTHTTMTNLIYKMYSNRNIWTQTRTCFESIFLDSLE